MEQPCPIIHLRRCTLPIPKSIQNIAHIITQHLHAQRRPIRLCNNHIPNATTPVVRCKPSGSIDIEPYGMLVIGTPILGQTFYHAVYDEWEVEFEGDGECSIVEDGMMRARYGRC